jgi:hypothetical protein
MKATEVLKTIWHTYQVTQDCLKIAGRSIEAQNLSVLKNTEFITSTAAQARQAIQESRDNADDYVILSLWVAFERILFDCLRYESERILSHQQSGLTLRVHQKIASDLGYWKIDDVLEIFKVVIDPQIIGQARQIKRYRDWIAHKNPKKPMPQVVEPKIAYRVLLEIIHLLEEHPNITRAYQT